MSKFKKGLFHLYLRCMNYLPRDAGNDWCCFLSKYFWRKIVYHSLHKFRGFGSKHIQGRTNKIWHGNFYCDICSKPQFFFKLFWYRDKYRFCMKLNFNFNRLNVICIFSGFRIFKVLRFSSGGIRATEVQLFVHRARCPCHFCRILELTSDRRVLWSNLYHQSTLHSAPISANSVERADMTDLSTRSLYSCQRRDFSVIKPGRDNTI